MSYLDQLNLSAEDPEKTKEFLRKYQDFLHQQRQIAESSTNNYNYYVPKVRKPRDNKGVMPPRVVIPTEKQVQTVAQTQPKPKKLKDIEKGLKEILVGQDHVIESVIPYVRTWRVGLCSPTRPAGIFMLLGPTGTGKTKTIEALAQVLHGDPRKVVKIDCAEYQMDHEIAKLIGSPPGYLGHRETGAYLNQARLTAAQSENCKLSLILFDEVEKAAITLTRLLLGILDKGTLNLGDNTQVSFLNTMIFMTSNIGANKLQNLLNPNFGFEKLTAKTNRKVELSQITSISTEALKHNERFSPEFLNRVDETLVYSPLGKEAISKILDLELLKLQELINTSGTMTIKPQLSFSDEAKEWLIAKGFDTRYGARELKRVLFRNVMQPLTDLLEDNPGALEAKVIVADNGLVLI